MDITSYEDISGSLYGVYNLSLPKFFSTSFVRRDVTSIELQVLKDIIIHRSYVVIGTIEIFISPYTGTLMGFVRELWGLDIDISDLCRQSQTYYKNDVKRYQ